MRRSGDLDRHRRSLMWQQVRRILRRLFEVVFSYLQIVFHRYSYAVAD